MRIPTRTMVTVCAVSAALCAAGCAGTGVKQARVGEVVFLQAATDRGPAPFTASAATAAGTVVPRVRAGATAGELAAPLRAARTLSGATPGLYAGAPHVAGCDTERQVRHLTADASRAGAFARVAGVGREALPAYLRGLTPVVLAADTRVTNHSYRDHRADDYQAVLQAGTAVLVDDRGVPRVRCACGNPLGPPEPTHGGAAAHGTAWAGYRPNKVVVVSPAPRAVASLTLVDAVTRTWTERRVGPDVRRDRVVPAPPATASPSETARASADTTVTGHPTTTGSHATADPPPPAPTAPSPPATAQAPGRDLGLRNEDTGPGDDTGPLDGGTAAPDGAVPLGDTGPLDGGTGRPGAGTAAPGS
ncbi:DUF6777 domain-containing protein [Streptomyces sp. NPDC051132]|uniref:DUF6777 domain-containing protein n=1 Tax=unclassified Streptomyces TaxID=2593676 RepID=UPI0034411735